MVCPMVACVTAGFAMPGVTSGFGSGRFCKPMTSNGPHAFGALVGATEVGDREEARLTDGAADSVGVGVGVEVIAQALSSSTRSHPLRSLRLCMRRHHPSSMETLSNAIRPRRLNR